MRKILQTSRHTNRTRSPFILILFLLPTLLLAQIPANYYNTAVGKSEAALKTQLCVIVGPHTARTYDNLWTDFQKTDKRTDGKVLDIYSSTTNYTFITNQCGNYSGEGSCYNREHSFPKSWFGDETPMYSDLFHLYPSDGYVNGRRGNDPFGEVGTVSYASNNSYCKSGTSSFPGYTGQVFEPTDTLKGDFARTYFHMVTAYDDKVANWRSPQLAGNQYPALSNWSIAMFLKWHRQDPVGPKELARNNAIYGIQHNRNPFIDHPELAEYIWGNQKGNPWSLISGLSDVELDCTVVYNQRNKTLVIDSEVPNLGYSIYSLNGQLFQESQLPTDHTIKVDRLRNGMYLLQLKAANRRTVKKIMLNN